MGKGIKAMKVLLAIADAMDELSIKETGHPALYLSDMEESVAIRQTFEKMIEDAEKKEEVEE